MELCVDVKKKLPGFTLRVEFGAGQDATGLLGASGSGKSMTLRCIAGIEKPDSGRIVLNGRVLFDSDKGVNVPARKRRVGYLFQNYALFPNMTVEENIGFALSGLPREERNAAVRQKIAMMKLEGLEKRYPSQLSGGQQQRTALARALAIEPEALLLDEPFSALDEHLRSLLVRQLLDTLSGYGGVTLFVSHNMEEAYKLCRRLVMLKSGTVETAGDREDIFRRPATVETARLTGCRNFSAASRLDGGRLYAADWDVVLDVNDVQEEGAGYVGIHSHCIRLAREDDHENVYECRPHFASETPFGATVCLAPWKSRTGGGDSYLEWDMPKEKWQELKDRPQPWRVWLDPDKLMTFGC